MEKNKRRFLWALIILFFILPAGQLFSQSGQMSVVIKEAQIRSTPTFLGKIVAVVPYGERLEVLKESNDWVQVLFGKDSGWVHKSALTKKKIVLASGKSTGETGASSDEIALAGKGFNKQVEAQYKDELHLNYEWVDRMETIVVSPEEAAEFLLDGKLELDLEAGR